MTAYNILGEIFSEEDVSLEEQLPVTDRLGTKTYEHFKNKYWYQTDGDYIRIGCTAKYKVKNTNSHVKAFKNKINSCNKNMTNSGLSVTVASIGVAALFVLSVTTPIGVLVTVAIAAMGANANSARSLVNAYFDYHDATDEYDMAKVAGTKY